MTEFNVTASVNLHLEMDIEADSHEKAKEEMEGYLENSANIESEFYNRIQVMDFDVEDVNEND